MAIVVNKLSVAAGNTAKDKRTKEASNRSQAHAPAFQKIRFPTISGRLSFTVHRNLTLFAGFAFCLHHFVNHILLSAEQIRLFTDPVHLFPNQIF